MVYWFTGQPGHGKTVLGKLLVDYLEDNSDLPCIMIDGDDIRNILNNKDYSLEGRIKNITFAQNLSKFLHNKGFNVVVSLVAPYKEARDNFKKDLGDNMVEIYVYANVERGRERYHSEYYQPPTTEYIGIDTTYDTPQQSIDKIIKYVKI